MGLATRIIPCLDVSAGRVVKGVNFVGLRDAGDPVEIAARYDAEGADELTFLDITASSDDRDILLHVIEAVAERADRGPGGRVGGLGRGAETDDAKHILGPRAPAALLVTGLDQPPEGAQQLRHMANECEAEASELSERFGIERD